MAEPVGVFGEYGQVDAIGAICEGLFSGVFEREQRVDVLLSPGRGPPAGA